MMRGNRLLSIATAIVAFALLPTAARAQTSTGPPCDRRAQVVDILHKTFGERLIGSGLTDGGTVIEVYAGPAGNWTMIITNAAGISCLVATGQAWETERAPSVSS